MEALPNGGTCDIFLRIWIDDEHAIMEAVHIPRHQQEDGLPLRRVSDGER